MFVGRGSSLFVCGSGLSVYVSDLRPRAAPYAIMADMAHLFA